MAFSKTIFVNNQTVIDAATLNAIQDELIRVAGLLGKDIQSAAINDSGHLILTLTDGTTLDAGVAKGAKGDAGGTGADGVTPHIGDNGNWYIGSTDTGKPSRGATGANGSDGAQGEKGATGPAGPQGPAGAPGKTPVRGTDYWTAADKQEIVSSVISALPDGTEVEY